MTASRNRKIAARLAIIEALAAPSTRFGVAAAFVVLVFAIGGGSRNDIIALALLRPLAFGFLLYALLVMRAGDLRAVRVPLGLLLALAGLMALQLAPLPPSWWTGLPGRELTVQIFAAGGIDTPWLPLSVSPSRTLNSAMSLAVPLAGLLLFAVQEVGRKPALLAVVWAMAMLSVVIGILQLVGPEHGPLYFYNITNNGLPVGLFANRNHQALMVCFAILLSGYRIASGAGWNGAEQSGATRNGAMRNGAAGIGKIAAAGAVLICVPFLLIAGSRAGLLIGLAMILAAAMLVHLAHRSGDRKGRSAAQRRSSWLIKAEFAAVLALLVTAFVTQSRSLALDRLLATGDEFELRGQVWPVLAQLVRQNWLAGTGFGSFEFVFKQAEPLALLRPAYLNQAHNDWAQWLIEGGLPALTILAGFLVWLAMKCARLGRDMLAGRAQAALAGLLIMLAFAAASLADYPLRVPALMLVFTLACGLVASAEPRRQKSFSAGSGPDVSPNAAQGAFPA